jgi:sec-independent protein translocase protein TatA
MGNIGPLEIAIVLIIALIVVGPKKLPGLGKSLGTGMREFKDSISGAEPDRAQLTEARTADTPRTSPSSSERTSTAA